MTTPNPTSRPAFPVLKFLPASFRAAPWQTCRALFYLMTRKRVRGCNLLAEAVSRSPDAYRLWIALHEPKPAEPSVYEGAGLPPSVSLILIDDPRLATMAPSSIRRDMLDWIGRQTARPLEVINVIDPDHSTGARIRRPDAGCHFATWDEAVSAIAGDVTVVLPVGSRLAAGATAEITSTFLDNPDVVAAYWDEDSVDEKGRRSDPWFKPQWNRELFLSQEHLLSACAVRTDTLRDLSRGAQGDVAVPFVRLPADPHLCAVHIPLVLTHHQVPDRARFATDRLDALAEVLRSDRATVSPGPFATARIAWPEPTDWPGVDIIVPTRNHLEDLQLCLGSVFERSSYPAFKVTVVDNGSDDPATLEFLASGSAAGRFAVIEFPGPFNFSAINNHAVQCTNQPLLCFLNNDTEVLTSDWLEELVRQAVRPGVGAVGPRLLYHDRSLQHAGIIIGQGGAAGHPERFLADGDPGFFARTHVAQYVSAVTAACMVVTRDQFEQVGGFDEIGLKVAYNDVDLCLRIEAAGARNLYVPHVELMHYETKSRGNDLAPANVARYLEELAVFRNRWKAQDYRDPLHHPKLSLTDEQFRLRFD